MGVEVWTPESVSLPAASVICANGDCASSRRSPRGRRTATALLRDGLNRQHLSDDVADRKRVNRTRVYEGRPLNLTSMLLKAGRNRRLV